AGDAVWTFVVLGVERVLAEGDLQQRAAAGAGGNLHQHRATIARLGPLADLRMVGKGSRHVGSLMLAYGSKESRPDRQIRPAGTLGVSVGRLRPAGEARAAPAGGPGGSCLISGAPCAR